MKPRVHVVVACVAIVGATLAPAFAGASTASLDPTVIEVHPTGLHPLDAENVQWALDTIDSPGIVVMKATDEAGNPLAFNFGGTGTVGSGAVISMMRSGITLTGEGWDEALGEPRTKIVGGGAPFRFTPLVGGVAMVFAVNAPGVTIRDLKLVSTVAYTAVWVDSVNQAATNWPVVVERNDFDVVNLATYVSYSAAFPVKIRHNVLRATSYAAWIGFSHRTIADNPGEELVVPVDAAGNPVRYGYEFTNNRLLLPTNHPLGFAVWVFGWGNLYSQNPDPDVACRRGRLNASLPFVYEYAPADNGPVVISGNHITVNSLDAPPTSMLEVVRLGSPYFGVNHVAITDNRLDGAGPFGISLWHYVRNITIARNDLSGLVANVHLAVQGREVSVTDNVLGPQAPFPSEFAPPPGLAQPALFLVSLHQLPDLTPVPKPVEGCLVARNDYRRTGVRRGAILIASQIDLQWTLLGPVAGNEVKHNVIFESGGFPPGTGGARNQVVVLTGAINPATGLPWTYDNRVVGHPANEIQSSGIGPFVHPLVRMRGLPEEPDFER